jgi:hypothetical protein
MAFVLSTVEKLKWLISLFWHSSWLHDFSLVFKHLFPDAFTETNFPNALNEVGSFGLAGVVFALLSHLFFDGTHFEMLGLYLASHPDLMDCIIYEFFLAVTLDEPIFRRFVYMEVSLSHVPFVIVYLFTVMILGLCSFMIHLPLYLYWVFMTAIEYLVRAELIYIHVFARSLGLGTLPVSVEFPVFLLWNAYLSSVLVGVARRAVGLIIRRSPDLIDVALLVPLVYLPWIWNTLSKILRQMKELFIRLERVMVLPLSFRKLRGQSYTYESLHTGDKIRLLRLRGRFCRPEIQCELLSRGIDQLPPYECISYCWGTSLEEKVILLSGRHFKVSTNVYDILCQRRALFASRLLWIDSVCINQTDDTEKSHQVRKMQTIYAKAARVTVCLGEAPDAHLARRLSRVLYSHILWTERTHWTETIIEHYMRAEATNNMAPPPDWLALTRLLRNQWFERCWVVQEVVLARKVYVIYGGRYIDWDMLLGLTTAFTDELGGPIRRLLSNNGPKTFASAPIGLVHGPILETYRRKYGEGNILSLHALLKHCLTFKATNCRDKIFALQGITEAATALPIDYQLSIDDVLINIAHYFMKRPEAMKVLQNAGFGLFIEAEDNGNAQIDGNEGAGAQNVKRPILPSWVVDWSRTRRFDQGNLWGYHQEGTFLYRAAVEMNPQIREIDRRTIELGGVHIDCIRYRGRNMQPPWCPAPDDMSAPKSPEDRLIHWVREADSIANDLLPQYSTGQSRFEAFWRTCIADRSGLNRPADPEYGSYMENFKYNTLMECKFDWLSNFRGWQDILRERITPAEQEWLDAHHHLGEPDPRKAAERMQEVALFYGAIGSACQGKCFAVTEKGYMVIAPPGTREGDMVCLIMGAEVPFILRPLLKDGGEVTNRASCYALIGECYVHGMMDGEGLRQGLEEQHFVIR